MTDRTYWMRCSGCKAEIGFGELHYQCSVSTCTRKRTGMQFCSVSCWEAHLPMMRHREAFAVEARAPSRSQWEAEQAAETATESERRAPEPVRRTSSASPSATSAPLRRRVAVDAPESVDDLPRDVLLVASKLKMYVRARSGMNTSDGVMTVLSDYVRKLCDAAIREAGTEDRKTVLDRDFRKVFSRLP